MRERYLNHACRDSGLMLEMIAWLTRVFQVGFQERCWLALRPSGSGSQTSATPENLLEMQILGLTSELLNSRLSNVYFHELSQCSDAHASFGTTYWTRSFAVCNELTFSCEWHKWSTIFRRNEKSLSNKGDFFCLSVFLFRFVFVAWVRNPICERCSQKNPIL